MYGKRVSIAMGVLTALQTAGAYGVYAQAQSGTIELSGIVVTTANKRPQQAQNSDTQASESTDAATGQPLEKADANLSVKSRTELKAAGVEKVEDLEKVFPGLSVRTRGNRAYANFTVRGMSSPDYYSPSVQILVDGVPQAAASFTQDLLDVEQVEFLRGPQGVLYGANAYGGVLNIVTRKPRENTAAGSTTISNLRKSVQASATGVLSPHEMFLDVAIKREWDPGEINDVLTGKDDIDDADTISGRVALRYAPKNGPFDATLTLSRDDVKARDEMYIRQVRLDAREYDLGLPYSLLDRQTTTASAQWNYRFGNGFVLTSISGYQDVDIKRNLVGYSFPESEEAVSQEIRLAYGDNGPLTGVAGLYFRDSDFTHARPGAYNWNDINNIGTESLAAFGDLTWHITKRLDLTGGVRVSRDKSTIDYEWPAYLVSYSDEAEFNSTQPKVSLGYQLSDKTHVHALVSQGYKAGGFQHVISNPLNPAEFAPYNPETAWNYEAGFRTTLLNNTFDLSATVYHIVAEDKQIYVGPIGQQTLRNAGEAESTGIEVEAQWRATKQLLFKGTLNYGRSEFTDFVDPTTSADYTGNSLPYAPDLTGTLLARYTFADKFQGATVALTGGARFSSTTYFDEANSLSQGAFAIYDTSLEFAWDNGVSLKLFADNITDKVYSEYSFVSPFPPYAGSTVSIPSEGRMIGVTLSAKY